MSSFWKDRELVPSDDGSYTWVEKLNTLAEMYNSNDKSETSYTVISRSKIEFAGRLSLFFTKVAQCKHDLSTVLADVKVYATSTANPISIMAHIELFTIHYNKKEILALQFCARQNAASRFSLQYASELDLSCIRYLTCILERIKAYVPE